MPFRLFNTPGGPIAASRERYFETGSVHWDDLLNMDQLHAYLGRQAERTKHIPAPDRLLAPIGSQEIWGAGVTYFRSRVARMEESKEADGGSFYDRVYAAARPELFLKATPLRVAPPGGTMRLRRDSKWIVPEAELTLVINARNEIIGYTIGNDLTCRDIEGENPLYLPQAKIFDQCAAIGPALLIQDEPLPASTAIGLQVFRNGMPVVEDGTNLSELKRDPRELVDYLVRETHFPTGCFLMTGTGIVPDDRFSLHPGDEVRITIEPIGTLVNTMS
jgi:2-dehydro-3-deoxy-D-arabinonate dehydratase